MQYVSPPDDGVAWHELLQYWHGDNLPWGFVVRFLARELEDLWHPNLRRNRVAMGRVERPPVRVAHPQRARERRLRR